MTEYQFKSLKHIRDLIDGILKCHGDLGMMDYYYIEENEAEAINEISSKATVAKDLIERLLKSN